MRVNIPYEKIREEHPDEAEKVLEKLRKSRSKHRDADPEDLEWSYEWRVKSPVTVGVLLGQDDDDPRFVGQPEERAEARIEDLDVKLIAHKGRWKHHVELETVPQLLVNKVTLECHEEYLEERKEAVEERVEEVLDNIRPVLTSKFIEDPEMLDLVQHIQELGGTVLVAMFQPGESSDGSDLEEHQEFPEAFEKPAPTEIKLEPMTAEELAETDPNTLHMTLAEASARGDRGAVEHNIKELARYLMGGGEKPAAFNEPSSMRIFRQSCIRRGYVDPLLGHCTRCHGGGCMFCGGTGFLQ